MRAEEPWPHHQLGTTGGGVLKVVPAEVGRGVDGRAGVSSLLPTPTFPLHFECLPPSSVIQ
jgi:hypothetical protein